MTINKSQSVSYLLVNLIAICDCQLDGLPFSILGLLNLCYSRHGELNLRFPISGPSRRYRAVALIYTLRLLFSAGHRIVCS
jgi:hypothetical protein